MIWQGFTRAHTPLIEGLRHGGQAQHLRRALTAFGSGWRGLVKLPMNLAPGMIAGGISLTPIGLKATRVLANLGVAKTQASQSRLLRLFEGLPINANMSAVTEKLPELQSLPFTMRKVSSDLRSASRWSKVTGMSPIAIFDNALMSGSDVRHMLRHERIHSVHMPALDHPFFQEKVKQAPTLKKLFKDQRYSELDAAIKQVGLSGEEVAEARKGVDALLEGQMKMYRAQSRSIPGTRSLERLAYHNQNNPKFIPEAVQAGFKDPRTYAFNPRRRKISAPIPAPLPEVRPAAPPAVQSVVKQTMQAGEHVHETSSIRRIFSRIFSSTHMPRGL